MPQVERTCLSCGAVFMFMGGSWESKARRGKFCSRHCRDAHCRGRHLKGGRYIHESGYVMVLDHEHPNANAEGYVFEHRRVMAAHVGRPLTSREVVHHINGIKSDNRIENLQLLESGSVHAKVHDLGHLGVHFEPQTHCVRGHELAGDNIVMHGGRRRCRMCSQARQRARRITNALRAYERAAEACEPSGDPEVVPFRVRR